MPNGDQNNREAGGDNKWAVMGGLALNVEYTRKYGFEATAAARVTAKLVAIPPPSAFQEAVQADTTGRAKRAEALAPPSPWVLPPPGGPQRPPVSAEPGASLPRGGTEKTSRPTPAGEGSIAPPTGLDSEEFKTISWIEEDRSGVEYTLDDGVGPVTRGRVAEDGTLTLRVSKQSRKGVITFADDPEPLELIFDESLVEPYEEDLEYEDADYSDVWEELEEDEVDDELDELGKEEDESVTRWRFKDKAGKAYTFNDGIGPELSGIVPEDGYVIHEYSPKASKVTLKFEGNSEPTVINISS